MQLLPHVCIFLPGRTGAVVVGGDMQMTPAQLCETGFPLKAGLVLVPLPVGRSTLRRPDGKVAHIDVMIVSKGYRAAVGQASVC